MIKLSSTTPDNLKSLYGSEVGVLTATETRDGVAFVSISLTSVELSGIPLDYIEEVPDELIIPTE